MRLRGVPRARKFGERASWAAVESTHTHRLAMFEDNLVFHERSLVRARLLWLAGTPSIQSRNE
jgi:hypothetical protein